MKKNETFSHIENPLLRAWNRAQMSVNISDREGIDSAVAYVEQFDVEDQARIEVISLAVLTYGEDRIRKEVLEVVGFDDSAYDAATTKVEGE